MPLTALDVKQAKPTDKPRKLADGGGLYLLVNPNGSKWWRWAYRFGGKEKTLSMGIYPETSLAEAREKHANARKLLAGGIDPSAERQDAKRRAAETQQAAVDTFEAVTRVWLEQVRPGLAEVTMSKNVWIFETFLFPEIGQLPLAAVSPRVLLDVLRKIEKDGKAETARRAKIKAGQVFRWAILEGMTETDPTGALRGAIKRVKHKHHAAITDPAKIGQLLRDIADFSGQPITHAALRLAPLVFVRPGELRAAEWPEFDLDGGMWRIPGERMKMKQPHLVPLSSQAVAVLRELFALTGNGRYVFPSLRGASRHMSENTINLALRSLGYDGDTMTGHGFRAMASSRLNELGWNADAIERQLAHAESNEVRAAYSHGAKYLEERQRMMQAWANYLDGLREGGNVVAIRRQAKDAS
jgi:integrase